VLSTHRRGSERSLWQSSEWRDGRRLGVQPEEVPEGGGSRRSKNEKDSHRGTDVSYRAAVEWSVKDRGSWGERDERNGSSG